MTTFYRTTFTIDVISEEPLGDCLSLSQIDYAITDGACVGGNLRADEKQITGKEAAAALLAFGSTPDFFQLDNEGNLIDEQ